MNKMRVFAGALGMLGACFVASKAVAAGQYYLQAASGHLRGSWSYGGLTETDGRLCSPAGGSTNYNLLVHVPVATSAATNYTPTQYTTVSGAATVCSRLASFNSDGSFSAGPACSTASTMGGVVSVPANGSLFSEHNINSNAFGSACLNQVKVAW